MTGSTVTVGTEGTRARPAAPGEDELVAIVAALEVTWPRGVAGDAGARAATPRWRFSGRWWTKPIPARRDRPG